MTTRRSEATMIREFELKNHSRGEHVQPAPAWTDCEACQLIAIHEKLGRPFGDSYDPGIPRYLRRKPRKQEIAR